MKQRLRTMINQETFWLQLAFLISLSAVLGSVLLSNVMNLLPCELCWWQRIFMFPLPVIFGAALLQKRSDVFWYTLPLVVIGGLIALYHYGIQMIPAVADTCGPGVVSCTERQVDVLGFMTIPFGSLMAFTAIGVCLFMARRAHSNTEKA